MKKTLFVFIAVLLIMNGCKQSLDDGSADQVNLEDGMSCFPALSAETFKPNPTEEIVLEDYFRSDIRIEYPYIKSIYYKGEEIKVGHAFITNAEIYGSWYEIGAILEVDGYAHFINDASSGPYGEMCELVEFAGRDMICIYLSKTIGLGASAVTIYLFDIEEREFINPPDYLRLYRGIENKDETDVDMSKFNPKILDYDFDFKRMRSVQSRDQGLAPIYEFVSFLMDDKLIVEFIDEYEAHDGYFEFTLMDNAFELTKVGVGERKSSKEISPK